MKQEIREIPVEQIIAGDNDRRDFNQQALVDLAGSIKEHGLAQPITVRPLSADYQIVAGERRFRAIAQILKLETVPCIVRELSDEEASAIMLVENTSRVDLDPIAEGNAYQVRQDKFGWSADKIAKTAGVSVSRVNSRLKLLSLTEDIQHYVKSGNFPLGHAQAIITAELDNNRQRIALRVYNSAASMPLLRFRDVVGRLSAEQTTESQMGMFALETVLIQEVEADSTTASSGKNAVTGAPVNKKLPPVKIKMSDTIGAIMDRYISDLMQSGKDAEAQALGNVYNTLVSFNWTSVPSHSTLSKTATADNTSVNNRHCVVI